MKVLNKTSLTILLSVISIHFGYSQIIGKVNGEGNKAKFRSNTVVYLEKVNGHFKAPLKNPIMDQKKLVFSPHVMPVVAGTTVDFLNSDDVLHNVFCPDKCCKFDLGSYGKGVRKSEMFDKAGTQSVILCNVHPEMEAYIVVLQNPYFDLTDKEGNFRIENVPPGKYVLKVWNEKYKAKEQMITVSASDKLNVNFELTK